MFHRCILLLSLLSACCCAASAQETTKEKPSTVSDVEALIRQLGDDSYARREEATEKILKIGLPALPIVEKGVNATEPEIRYRCERLRLTLLDIDLDIRLEAFATDVNGAKDHRLPAWDRFSKLHGSGSASRKLFVAVFRAEPALLKASQDDAKTTADLLANRLVELQTDLQRQQTVKLGSVAAMLYAAAQPDVSIPVNSEYMIYNLCYQQAVRETLTGADEKKGVMKSLLADYIEQTEGQAAYQSLSLAITYDIPQGLKPARKFLEGRGAAPRNLMPIAAMVVAKFGSSEDLPEIEKLLDDKTVTMNIQIDNKRIQAQVRDYALVTALHLAKLSVEEIKAFGFERLQANESQLFATHTIGFENDDKRNAAFQKWTEQKDKLKAKVKDGAKK